MTNLLFFTTVKILYLKKRIQNKTQVTHSPIPSSAWALFKGRFSPWKILTYWGYSRVDLLVSLAPLPLAQIQGWESKCLNPPAPTSTQNTLR